MARVKGEDLFIFSSTIDPKSNVRVDSHTLPPLDREVIQALECFRSQECNIFIARDHEEGGGMEEYLCKSKQTYIF